MLTASISSVAAIAGLLRKKQTIKEMIPLKFLEGIFFFTHRDLGIT